MKLERVLSVIKSNRTELEKLQIKKILIFGSVARGEATADSDVDVLVEFSADVSLFHFVRTQRFLEELLNTKVDLVTKEALRPEWRDSILAEAVDAA